MRTTLSLSLLIFVFLTSCRHSRSQLLVNPDPLSVTGYGGAARSIIIESIRAKSWAVSREEPGKIHAMCLMNNKHEMRVLLSYDEDSIRMEYEDSRNLAYTKNIFGAEYIHSAYDSWTGALWWEITQRLSDLRTAEIK